MDWREFISSIISSIAWPIAVVALAFILRHRIEALLNGPLRRVKAGPGGVELEYWDRVAADIPSSTELTYLEESVKGAPPLPTPEAITRPLRAELESLARERPRDAVLEAHRRVESLLRRIVETKVPIAADAPDAVALTGLAAAHKIIDAQALQSLEGLNILRNLAEHSRDDELTPGRAMEYLQFADAAMHVLKTQSGSR